MAKTVGRLMPSRNPAYDANERFVFKTDSVGTYYEVMQALTPQRAKDILRMAELLGEIGPLYDLYERMATTDTRYGGLSDSYKAAIAGLRHKVVPAQTDSETEKAIAVDYANVMREVVANLDVQSVTKMFLDVYLTGAMLYQIRWELEDYAYGKKLWLPVEIAPVDGRALLVNKEHDTDRYGRMMVRTNDNLNGRLVDRLPFASALFLEDGYGRGRYERLGRARKCLPWYLGIQFVQSWWIQYIEGYASPIRIARHPRGADPKTKMDMERFLQVLGQHGYALFPNDMEVQLLEANRQGTITTYGDFIAKGHEEYAVALFGQASTVGSKGNTAPYAGAVVANAIRHENLQDGAAIASRGWKMLTEDVIRVNFGDQYIRRLLPKVQPVLITPAEMNTKAKVAETAQNNGVAVSEDFWYEQVLGTEPPRDGERAIVHGQVFVVGVDPVPEPMQNRAATEGSDENRERDRSVASPEGNPDYGRAE